jgi:hypothetical protein
MNLSFILLGLLLLVLCFLFRLRRPPIALLGQLPVLDLELLLAGLAGATAANTMSRVSRIDLR